jgi:hypothetical protein
MKGLVMHGACKLQIGVLQVCFTAAEWQKGQIRSP